MPWPAYFDERLWLVNPEEGFVGVVTLWTPKERIAPFLGRKVLVCGQLYSKRGIEFIIRNSWLNPKIRYLVLVGKDNLGSGEALVKFFKNGVKKGNGVWEIIGVNQAYLPQQISKRFLDEFRKKVTLIDLRGETNPQKINKKIAELKPRPPFANKPKTFPHAKLEAKVFPSEISGIRIEAQTIGLAWLQILKTILKFGWEIPRVMVYGGKERMVLNLMAVITGEDIKNPKIYPFFLFKKLDLLTYLKNFFSPNRGKEVYTYGERIFKYQKSPADLGVINQLDLMAKKLKSFPYNKGALITLWNASIDNFPVRKPWRTPCLTLIQGICQGERLHLTAYIRSNDMFGGWPQNAFALRKLQTELARQIDKQVGFLTTVSQSAFIDETDLAEAERIVKENGQHFYQVDPRGNLVISVEGRQIVVKQMSPDGLFLAEFRQNGLELKAALRMAEKLLKNQVISRIDHALDIGEQLGRAEDAIKLGLKFEQDRQLRNKSR